MWRIRKSQGLAGDFAVQCEHYQALYYTHHLRVPGFEAQQLLLLFFVLHGRVPKDRPGQRPIFIEDVASHRVQECSSEPAKRS